MAKTAKLTNATVTPLFPEQIRDLDRATIERLHSELLTAAEGIFNRYGLSSHKWGGQIGDGTDCVLKIKLQVLQDKSGKNPAQRRAEEVADKFEQERRWLQTCIVPDFYDGITREHLGRRFAHEKYEYEIVGIAAQRAKTPLAVICRTPGRYDGVRYYMHPRIAARALGLVAK